MLRDRVVIVGGGVTGALTAVRLAASGFAVTVIEKADIGHGSSRRSAAAIRAQFSVPETVAGMMYAEWYYRHFHELLQTPGTPPAVLRQNGYLFLYERPDAIRPNWSWPARQSAEAAWSAALRSAAMQQGIGLPVEVLTAGEIQDRWPHLDCDRLIGATWCAQDGILDAQAIYRRGFARASELGATVVTGTEVIGATLRRGAIRSLETTAGSFEADWFLNATNAWAARFSALVGGMRLDVKPVKRYLYLINPTQAIADSLHLDALPMTIFGGGAGRGSFAKPVFRRTGAASLQIGRAHDARPEPDFADSDQDLVQSPFDHRGGPDTYGYHVLSQVGEFAPKLASESAIVSTDCEYYGVTPDHTPIIGLDENQANLVHAVGCSGHGLMHAPFTAALVEAVLSSTADRDNDEVTLPDPCSAQVISMARFAPGRSFAETEGMVL